MQTDIDTSTLLQTLESSPQTTDNSPIVVLYRTLTLDIARPSKEPPKKKNDPAAEIRAINIHKLNAEEAFLRYRSHPTLGLETPALVRLRKEGKLNKLSPPKTNNLLKSFGYVFGGFNSLMWLAMILSFISYQPLGGDNPQVFNLGVAVLLLIVILISALFYGFASQAMKSIRQLVASTASVTRNGINSEIDSLDLQPGDIVHLSLGQRVPADLFLYEVSPDFRIDRSLLTGESDPTAGSTLMTDENPLETKNLALSSTFVVQGTANGLVFATGDSTVIGRIFTLSTKQSNDVTILQKELNRFTIIISITALTSFVVSLLVWGVFTRVVYPGFADVNTAIINSIGCLTAFVPQGLPVSVALALTIVARRMAARKVLVKNLSIIETIGAMTILCSDKTGTLTEGKMSVENIGFVDATFQLSADIAEKVGGKLALLIAFFCNDTTFVDGGDGNSTDVAVYMFAIAPLNTASLTATYERVFSIPFNSKSKYMLVIVKSFNGLELLVKGAPDILATYCTTMIESDGNTVPIDHQRINELQELWSKEGQRVIMTCHKKLSIKDIPANGNKEMDEFIQEQLCGLSCVSLIGILDPPRKDVPNAVTVMRSAGIRIFMVTGDFKLTAESIARKVGIVTAPLVDSLETMRLRKDLYEHASRMNFTQMKPNDLDAYNGLVLDGRDVLDLTSHDWDVVFSFYPEIVFARTTPEQKMIIVTEAKKRGDSVVAVTGDGALKVSNVGIAMGAGSDVAKEAASVILLNNDFASIPVAIENGRLVFENLRKVVLYLLPAGSYTEALAVFSNVFFGMQIPLTSYLQVFFSILNDVTMSISLMYESDLMMKKPRNIRTSRLVDWKFFVQVYLFIGPIIWLSSFGMFFYYWSTLGFGFYDLFLVYDRWVDGYKGLSLKQLNAYLAISQCIFYVTMIGNILAVRNRRMSIIESNPFYGPRRNLVLIISITTSITLAVMNIYISTAPGVSNIFVLGPVPVQFWFLPVPLAFGLLLADETRKLVVRSYPKSWVARAAW